VLTSSCSRQRAARARAALGSAAADSAMPRPTSRSAPPA
jgi:hypothetical protein